MSSSCPKVIQPSGSDFPCLPSLSRFSLAFAAGYFLLAHKYAQLQSFKRTFIQLYFLFIFYDLPKRNKERSAQCLSFSSSILFCCCIFLNRFFFKSSFGFMAKLCRKQSSTVNPDIPSSTDAEPPPLSTYYTSMVYLLQQMNQNRHIIITPNL